MKKRKIGYIRVSTEDQKHDRQIDVLGAICDKLFLETYSAKTQKRPVFQTVLKTLEAGDTLVVLSVDRAFRSVVDAINQAEKLKERGIIFQILNLAVDTGTADGKLAYTIVAAVAAHERERISERTKQGLISARKRGKRLGRPPKLTKLQTITAMRKIRAQQANRQELAEEYDVHPETLARHIREIIKGSRVNPDVG